MSSTLREYMSKTTCNHENCRFDAYSDNLCSLHFPKSSYSEDFEKTGLLESFYNDLMSYIVSYITYLNDENSSHSRENITVFLKGNTNNFNIKNFVNQQTITLDDIIFPESNVRDNFNFLKLLKLLNNVHFRHCEFNFTSLELPSVNCFYQNCDFKKSWGIFNSKMLKNHYSVLYFGCTFHEDVTSYRHSEKDEKYTIEEQLFYDCNFLKAAIFQSVIFKKPIFNNSGMENLNIHKLHLLDCEIEGKFVLNDCELGYFYTEDSLFKSKFEFKSNVVNAFGISNTNFSKVVDAYNTNFTKFEIRKSIFDDFVGFEMCEFGKKNSDDTSLLTKFTYATFLSFVNFRNTKFHSGLDIENINLKEAPNFLKTYISPQNSNRETFRIVKNSFDKTGNYIEANKFFALEMSKYKNELNWKENWQELLVFKINHIISNYGQSYTRPTAILILISILYYLLTLGHDANIIYQLFPSFNDGISTISTYVNGWASSFIPFSKFLREGMEFISLIFYILNASLIWQIAVAIKRHTKR